MYHEHFGLHCNPFRPAPSGEFFYASRSHREALAALQWGLSDPTGLVLLTGDVGTGKTTVIRELFSRETGEVRTALIGNPKLPFDSLLEDVLRQIGAEVPAGRAAMLGALARASQSHRVVVVIDEAQQLSDEALEEFRLLSNSSPERLQLMLVGQPELLERLASPRLRQLNQRIAVRAVLNPLSAGETIEYLKHRIHAAGGEARRIFTWRSLRALARLSFGIPRRVNILSHNAMLLAYGSGSRRVYPKHVIAAAAEYDHTTPTGTTALWNRSIWRRSLPPAVLLVAGLAVSFFGRETTRGEALHAAPPVQASVAIPLADPRPVSRAAEPEAPTRTEEPDALALPARLEGEVAAKAPSKPIPAPEPEQVRPAPGATEAQAPEAAQGEGREVVVREGDTLSGIAERYRDSLGRIDVRDLLAANPEIKDANLIYPGEKVRLTPR
jgi:general secretion pathway protein A